MNQSGAMRETQALYEERCRHVLSLALNDTPMYASWASHDPGPSHALDERFRVLPLLTKSEIRSHFPYGLVPRGRDLDAARERGELSYVHTSGTSDEALENIWNQKWWDESERASWTLNEHAAAAADGKHREAILASAFSVGPKSEGPTLPTAARMLGRFLFLNEFGRTESWPRDHERRILSEMSDYQPVVLEANPSLLARVARWAFHAGVEVWQPALITLTYEYPSALHLRAIRRVYSCPIASSYGSTEAGYIFMECEHGSLHQNTDTCRVDMLPLPGQDPQGEVAPGGPGPRSPGFRVQPGGLGRIIVTTLGNDWFPLLRFDVGDVGRLAVEPCTCGRRFGVTLSAVEGRMKSLCRAGDGAPVTHRQIDTALAGVDGLAQYRVDQETPDVVRCAVMGEPDAPPGVDGAARDALAALFGPRVRIDARAVSLLVPEASGKFLLVLRSFPFEEVMHG